MVLPEEGESLYSQRLDSKKNTIRNLILTLATEWNDLDEHLDSTKESFAKSLADMESERRTLESSRASVVESNKQLDSVRESLATKSQELEHEKEKFCVSRQLQIEEAELKEEKLGEQRKSIEVLLANFDKEKREFLDIQEAVSGKLKEIVVKESMLRDQSKEVERREKEIDSKEEKLNSKAQEVESLQKSNEEWAEQLRLKDEQLKLVSKKRKRTPSDDCPSQSPRDIREAFDILGMRGIDNADKCKLRIIEVAKRFDLLERECRDAIDKAENLEADNKDYLKKLEAADETSYKRGYETAVQNCLKQVKAIGDEKSTGTALSEQLRLKDEQLKLVSKKRKRTPSENCSPTQSPQDFREAFDMLGMRGIDNAIKCKLRIIEVAKRIDLLERERKDAIDKAENLEADNKDLLEGAVETSYTRGYETAVQNCLKQVKAIRDEKGFSN